MKTLKDGIIKFQQNYFSEHKEIFSELAKTQKPHTLYIGCSDSRVVPNIITKAMPGELFVVRNIGNMVPPYGSDKYQFRCTSSIIEYAVKVLEVDNIVVCGHSNCGGCKALYYDKDKLAKTPLVKEWLSLADEVRDRILKKNLSYEEREFQTEQLNVVKQLENLLTYPFVKERFEKGELNIVGWYYVIETGDVFDYDFDEGEFRLIS
ncbi:MAG: carbonic anhydrase [Epsilonproteobacteria bacterium]|nr:carbonic anhydrase [Campylobacterota bacterium]